MMNNQETIAANTGNYASETQALEAVVARIVDQVDPEAIWLFGSRARGTHRPDSDFDLLVVTRLEDGESGYDYDRVYAPVLGTGVGCDVVPCRVDDCRPRLDELRPIICRRPQRKAPARSANMKASRWEQSITLARSARFCPPPTRCARGSRHKTTSPRHRPDTGIPIPPAGCRNLQAQAKSDIASRMSACFSPR